MILIKPDPSRRIDIPGIPAPVKRPVDIDPSRTGFTALRTLRIYQFDAAAQIDGHAEEDEVWIVVLTGSVELTIVEEHASSVPPLAPSHPVRLAAPDGAHIISCAAYLPPGAAYKLHCKTDADVAYVRATPPGPRRRAAFFYSAPAPAGDIQIVLEEMTHAERLRIRLARFEAHHGDLSFAPLEGTDNRYESLVHIQGTIETVTAVDRIGGSPAPLASWDTVAVPAGDSLTLNFKLGSTGWVLIASAS